MGLRKTFATDSQVENKGVVLEYGDTRIRIARAGGANKKFALALNEATRPLRRAIAADAVDSDQQRDILVQVYVDTVILSIENRVHAPGNDEPQWQRGILHADIGVEKAEGDANLLPDTKANILKLLVALPELFNDIQQQAQNYALFKADIDEELAKN